MDYRCSIIFGNRFNGKYQKTLIMMTHNEEMAAYADRIIQVKDGKVEDNNGIRESLDSMKFL